MAADYELFRHLLLLLVARKSLTESEVPANSTDCVKFYVVFLWEIKEVTVFNNCILMSFSHNLCADRSLFDASKRLTILYKAI